MAESCRTCGYQLHCQPDCPTLFWPDGTRRGSNPGLPPTQSMLLADELGSIFKGLAESAIEAHTLEMRTRDEG